MFFLRSQTAIDIRGVCGVMAMSILFRTTSMLAVTITLKGDTVLLTVCCLRPST